MPDPNRLLATLRQAADAFRATPGRRGHLVVPKRVGEVFVAGDLHGNVENFRLILQKADLANNPERHLVLQELIHGHFHYPAGGDKSHQLVDLLAALKCQFPRQVHLLLGNHELAQETERIIFKGDESYNELFRRGTETAYGERAAEVYAAYLALFAVVPLAVRTPNRVFLSHSLPSAARLFVFDPAILEQEAHASADMRFGGAVYALVWGRDSSAENAEAFLRKVDADLLITGHIASDQGFAVPNERQLILDCVGTPACYCLFPTDRALTHEELVACVGTL